MIGHPLKVRELLDEIERGEVLLPEIQRSYVWKGPQVTRLLDSIYRDYPTGQILLWDSTKQAPSQIRRAAQLDERQPQENCSGWSGSRYSAGG